MKSSEGPNIDILLGDVFESHASILIVPCSTSGSMGGAFRDGVKALGLTDVPGPLKAGDVAAVSVSRSESPIREVLLAAVVAPGDTSSAATIRRVEDACRRAGESASGADAVVAAPLLATGAGGLEPAAAVQAMVAGFTASAHPAATLRIYVLSKKLHDQLREHGLAPERTPTTSRMSLRPGTQVLLDLALAVATERGAPSVAPLDVVLAALARPAYTSMDRKELARGATNDLLLALPAPAEERVDAALAAVKVSLDGPPPRAGAEDPRLTAVVESAAALVRGLGGDVMWSHHLVGAALADEPIPAEVLAALRVSQQDLRVALRSGIARRWPSEAAAFWTSRLGASLQGGRTRLVHDQPALIDGLGRLGIAKEIAGLLQELASLEDRPTAFAMHLDAPWGAGKSTVVNFVARELTTGTAARADRTDTAEPWTVVSLDAWRSSQLSPAWWALLTHLRDGVRKSLGRRQRLAFDLRRLGRSLLRFWRLWIPSAAVLAILLVLWSQHTDVTKMTAGAAAIIGLAATVGGLANRFFSLGSVQGARLHERLSSNPMEEVATQIVAIQAASRRNILLVLDDLDRCNEQFTVELLDAVQTLLRNPRTAHRAAGGRGHGSSTLVVLAVGDGRWLRAAYEHTYSVFSPYVNEPGRPLGSLFLDKLFQVRVELPNPSQVEISEYLASLLEVEVAGGAPRQEMDALETLIRAAPEEQDDGAHSLDNRLSRIMADTTHVNATQRQSLAAMALETRRKDSHRAVRERHLLEDYAELVEPNPRAAKRFIMAYGIAFASRLADPHPIPAETLALWTLITIRWPALAEWIRSRLPDGSLEPIDLEHHPSLLLSDPQVKRALLSDRGGPLDRDALLRCCGHPVPQTAPGRRADV
jgi:KAP family P-loop domain